MRRVRLAGVEVEEVHESVDEVLACETRSDRDSERRTHLLVVPEDVREIGSDESVDSSAAADEVVEWVLEVLTESTDSDRGLKYEEG